MSGYTISEDRLKELGEAERVLKWAQGTMQDYIAGRDKEDVFDELILRLTDNRGSEDPVNDPLPLTPAEILAGADGTWKG